ncbi:Bestrophin, RFP-TM, chloride channel-domain-containing protein [Mycena alexandri]|uniref:Bestrophin, RFP-TM, chloride channel-domain-containing protein n=1 Tax=Mycena alexandri TaxID=1745969 RepID=A0AAD6SQJ3_9AGAR|nr:Bestrophin, RFP-TM, chloride channel-domain-containing protein [Mycena alexandri]
MVASNPLFKGWTVKKFNATVINDVWPEVSFFTLVAAMVALVTKLTSHSLAVPSSLLTVLGTVLGLVISFRTSTAYERYQDGRKMWTNITIASRNVAQIIWIHVPFERVDKDKKKMTVVQSVIEKKTMVNLVQAFSVAVKHFLRAEPGVYYEDLYPLICFLPRYANTVGPPTPGDMLPLWHASEDDEFPLHTATHPTASRSLSESDINDEFVSSLEKGGSTVHRGQLEPTPSRIRRAKTFDPEAALADVQSHRPLQPARNPPETGFFDFFPVFRIFAWMFSTCSRRMRSKAGPKKPKGPLAESNVPLEITIYLSAYLAHLLRNNWLAPALATGLMNNIASLQDTMSNLDRIGSTPLPFAYQAHLRMSLWLYLFFLPFQVVESFGYLTIPGTAFASFLLLGFLEIGQEIENPFNYDLNDLDLDAFCLGVQRELHEITAHTTPDPTQFIFSAWNQPLAPGDRRSAEELTANVDDYRHSDHADSEPGMMSIRRVLLKNWRDVDRITRQ